MNRSLRKVVRSQLTDYGYESNMQLPKPCCNCGCSGNDFTAIIHRAIITSYGFRDIDNSASCIRSRCRLEGINPLQCESFYRGSICCCICHLEWEEVLRPEDEQRMHVLKDELIARIQRKRYVKAILMTLCIVVAVIGVCLQF